MTSPVAGRVVWDPNQVSAPLVALALLAAIPLADSRETVLQAQSPASRRAVVDVHLHAFAASRFGAGAIDQSVAVREFGFQVAEPDGANLAATLDALRGRNVVKAVVSGPLSLVREWTTADPDLLAAMRSAGSLRTDARSPTPRCARLVG